MKSGSVAQHFATIREHACRPGELGAAAALRLLRLSGGLQGLPREQRKSQGGGPVGSSCTLRWMQGSDLPSEACQGTSSSQNTSKTTFKTSSNHGWIQSSFNTTLAPPLGPQREIIPPDTLFIRTDPACGLLLGITCVLLEFNWSFAESGIHPTISAHPDSIAAPIYESHLEQCKVPDHNRLSQMLPPTRGCCAPGGGVVASRLRGLPTILPREQHAGAHPPPCSPDTG